MRITIVNRNVHPEEILDLGDLDDEGGFIVQVNGKDLFAADLFYASGNEDPNPAAPKEPHINLGWWPEDAETWRILAHVPLDAAVDNEEHRHYRPRRTS